MAPEIDTATPEPSRPQPSAPRPSSYESDPDPSKTVFCTAPHSPSSPLVQYALMIDAGSTGSRIHVYKFNNCGPSPTYEYETFVQKHPGLSAFAGRPEEAAQSLDSLLDVAMRTVPEQLRRCTPVAVKATAGLRLLGAEPAGEILDAVRRRLSSAYPFPLASQDPVAIMDGRDEGVFAWVTANYLMDTIRADSPKTAAPYAVLDLGGASTQIVLEPVFDAATDMHEGDHKYELRFGGPAGKTHVLYQHSYLGYGLMRARKSVHRLVDFMAVAHTDTAPVEIGNPCLAQGTKRVVQVDGDGSSLDKNVTMIGGDIGSFEACNRIMQLVMAKDAYVVPQRRYIFAKANFFFFPSAFAKSSRARSTAFINLRSSRLSLTARSSCSRTSTTAYTPSSRQSPIPPLRSSPSPRSRTSQRTSASGGRRGRRAGAITRWRWRSSWTAPNTVLTSRSCMRCCASDMSLTTHGLSRSGSALTGRSSVGPSAQRLLWWAQS